MELTVQSVQLTQLNGQNAYNVFLFGTDESGQSWNVNLVSTTNYQVGDVYIGSLTKSTPTQ
ncbi:hypothetical protein NZD89_05250 [Alicyclobacillus fastidiosus]|uniref:Uncharacterized protein n=1 Tax=Alicyclobacillus fastidiosus TaxID=392011 RepID=A0ABY6ZL39_9BACL|nr:hypothetical protein [Alicyclobacillus fastidiosus]WAH42836.1 hypothetical protein NZD89_05250 [Alicyclobacillus fastidiosus]GMA64768.1 hypothetical protein GCM10025859_52080 [Alicyclobacillus fastidiosus]